MPSANETSLNPAPTKGRAKSRDAKYRAWEYRNKEVAEEEGFEPPVALTTPVFKTGAFNRSAIPPTERRFTPTA